METFNRGAPRQLQIIIIQLCHVTELLLVQINRKLKECIGLTIQAIFCLQLLSKRLCLCPVDDPHLI